MGVYFKVVTINLLKTETAFRRARQYRTRKKEGRGGDVPAGD